MSRGVSAEEKRVELEVAGTPWPRCDCHDVRKVWQKHPGCLAGGYWRCRSEERYASGRDWRVRNREYVKEQRAERLKSLQQRTAERATVPPGTPYSEGEDAVLLREDMSTLEKAYALGRTYASLTCRHRRLRAAA